MRSLPLEVRLSFNDQFMNFRSLDPSNVRPPAMFSFLAQYVSKIKKNYRSNPSLFDLNFSLAMWALKPFDMKPLAPNPNLRVHPLVETLNLLNVLAPYAPLKVSSLTTTLSTSTAASPS